MFTEFRSMNVIKWSIYSKIKSEQKVFILSLKIPRCSSDEKAIENNVN